MLNYMNNRSNLSKYYNKILPPNQISERLPIGRGFLHQIKTLTLPCKKSPYILFDRFHQHFWDSSKIGLKDNRSIGGKGHWMVHGSGDVALS